jgi:hypothetical protein
MASKAELQRAFWEMKWAKDSLAVSQRVGFSIATGSPNPYVSEARRVELRADYEAKRAAYDALRSTVGR